MFGPLVVIAIGAVVAARVALLALEHQAVEATIALSEATQAE